MVEDISMVVESIEDLMEDGTVPQSVRTRLQEVISTLKEEDVDLTIRVNQVLDVLEQITNDSNLPSYTRTDIMSISSMLEGSL